MMNLGVDCNRFFMPPKVELDDEEKAASYVDLGPSDERVQEDFYRRTLQDDLSGRHDMHANAAAARAAAFLMQLSANANCAVLLIGIVRILQVGGLLHVEYLHCPPISVDIMY